MCVTCDVLQQEVYRLRIDDLLSLASVLRAPPEHFESIKQLNNAKIELRVAEDLFKEHQLDHLERMIGIIK
jgi:hypothetical protein